MNILYTVCRDVGRHLGRYGHPTRTPALDACAAIAIQFYQVLCSTGVCKSYGKICGDLAPELHAKMAERNDHLLRSGGHVIPPAPAQGANWG